MNVFPLALCPLPDSYAMSRRTVMNLADSRLPFRAALGKMARFWTTR